MPLFFIFFLILSLSLCLSLSPSLSLSLPHTHTRTHTPVVGDASMHPSCIELEALSNVLKRPIVVSSFLLSFVATFCFSWWLPFVLVFILTLPVLLLSVSAVCFGFVLLSNLLGLSECVCACWFFWQLVYSRAAEGFFGFPILRIFRCRSLYVLGTERRGKTMCCYIVVWPRAVAHFYLLLYCLFYSPWLDNVFCVTHQVFILVLCSSSSTVLDSMIFFGVSWLSLSPFQKKNP